jgi:uncharacterized protein (DUF1501 family)
MGLAGFATLSLPELLAAQARATEARKETPSDTAVILVWCHGGPSHLETYDPKPDAPSEYRGPFGAIDSSVPGMRLSELMPLQAKIADRFTLLRSFHHRAFCHQQGLQTLLSGHEQLQLRNDPEHPDLFCVANKVRQRPGDQMPAYVGLPPLPYSGPAYLGPGAGAFAVHGDPNAPDFQVPNIRLEGANAIPRIERRTRLVHGLDAARRDLEASRDARARDQHYQAAVDLLTSGRMERAFDLSKEPTALRDRYGRTRWGQSMLQARRLVEAGVGAVVVSLFGVENGLFGNWDDHAVNCDCFKAMAQRAPIFDRAVSSLISDVYDRGLDRKTLIIVTGEFGRTPKVNNADAGRPGRDHWPHAFSILLSGGGIRTGQVIGATDSRAEYVDENPLEPNDLMATIYRHLGIDPMREFPDHTGRPIRLLDRIEPIRGLY